MTIKELINANILDEGTLLNLFIGSNYVWYSDKDSDIAPMDQLRQAKQFHDYKIDYITVDDCIIGFQIYLKEEI